MTIPLTRRAEQMPTGLSCRAAAVACSAALLAGGVRAQEAPAEVPQAQAGAPAAPLGAEAPPGPARPPFRALRYEEDYAEFRPGDSAPVLDRIKHISLTEDGRVWLSVGGQIRLRTEYWNDFGFSDGDDRDDVFLLGRGLLHGDLHVGDRFRIFVQGESALATDRDLPGGRRTLDVDSLDLQQAFADVVLFDGERQRLTVRTGRQELLFGKQRLVSPLPWSNSQRSWDGVRAIAELESWRIDAFYTRFAAVDKYGFNDWQEGPDFWGVYATRAAPPSARADALPYDIDVYYLGLDDRSAAFAGLAGPDERHTFGARIGGNVAETGFDFDLEGAYQFGEFDDADVSAWMVAAEVGHAWEGAAWRPRVLLGFDYASGDDDPTDGDIGTFNQLFPLGHAYFGYMDFVGRQNIIDVHAGASVRPAEKLTLLARLHFFWRASDDDALYNAGGGIVRAGGLSSESEVGQELDIVATWKVGRHTTIEAGYAHFFAGDFIEESGSSDDMDWAYLQVVFNF